MAVDGKSFPRYAMEHHPKLELRYPVLQEWAEYMKDLRLTAQRMPVSQRTTKAVVEQYFKNKQNTPE